MKDFILYVARALAECPDDVTVTQIEGEQTAILELRCSPKDLGRLIGKNGKTVGALRTLVSNLAAKQGQRAMLEVVE